MTQLSLPPGVLSLLEQQYGMVTLEQAELAGVERRTLTDAVLRFDAEQVAPGVIRIGIARTFNEPIFAEWLRLAPAISASERMSNNLIAVVSHESAAELLGLDANGGKPAFTPVDVLAPHEWTVIDSLPVTTATRTLADLCAESADIENIARMAVLAIESDLASVAELSKALGPFATSFGANDENLITRLRQIDDLRTGPS